MNILCKASAYLGIQCPDKLHGLKSSFQSHIAEHGLSYATPEEYEFRFELFIEKQAKIDAINSMEGNTFKLGHNKFSTWTDQEFKQLLGDHGNRVKAESTLPIKPITSATVDWREKGAVNPVQDQGRCGSCWAFSSVASMEGAWAIKNGDLPKLAEQQLVDCDKYKDNNGCNGGTKEYGFLYAETTAMENESSYPYKARDTRCKVPTGKGKGTVTMKGWNDVTPNKKDALTASIQQGPTAISLAAGNTYFQLYDGGILNAAECPHDYHDHAVVGVGYGTENGTDYVIIRNSWGSGWGEDSYIRIANEQDGDGICGILLAPSLPEANSA